MTTSNMKLPLLTSGQNQKHVTVNEAMSILDTATWLVVIAVQAAPPSSVSDGDVYIVAASGTAAWLGKDHKIAMRVNGGWVYGDPKKHMIARVGSEGVEWRYDGAKWEAKAASIAKTGLCWVQDQGFGWNGIWFYDKTWHNIIMPQKNYDPQNLVSISQNSPIFTVPQDDIYAIEIKIGIKYDNSYNSSAVIELGFSISNSLFDINTHYQKLDTKNINNLARASARWVVSLTKNQTIQPKIKLTNSSSHSHNYAQVNSYSQLMISYF